VNHLWFRKRLLSESKRKKYRSFAEYTKYVASMLKELGYKNADAAAKGIVDYEKSIAKTYLNQRAEP
jgi:hypothetical protein